MHPKLTSRALSEGALMATLAALLALIGMYLPPLRLVTDVIWTIPIVVLIIRHDLKTGAISLTVAALLVMMLSDPIQAGFLVLQFGSIGLLYGISLKRNVLPGKIILGGSLVAVAAQLVIFFLLSRATGFSLVGFEEGMKAQVAPTIQLYERLGLTSHYANQGISEKMLRDSMLEMIRWMKLLLPGMLITASVVAALFNYLVVVIVLRKLRFPVKPLPPFREWQLPWYCAWGVIVGLGLLLGGDYYRWAVAGAAGKNILLIYSPFLFVFGLSVATYFYKTWKLPGIAKAIIVVLAIMNIPLAVMVVTSLGLFDSLLNYRRLASRNSQ